MMEQNEISGSEADNGQIEVLKKHFPQCFDKHGKFIPQKLNSILEASDTEFSKESYSLNWLGKSYARLLANESPLTLLSEDKKHNQKPENKDSENLLIKGDNLEVLKHLKGAYSESIKMIYIDPPYNTGSDGFVYQDDRKFTVDELSKLAGIDKGEAQRVLDFTESKANSHSAWLTFMYPRLYVARDLLKDDGVIFISIDENEMAQLKILTDEVFGEQNFITSFIWKNKKGGGNDSKYVAIEHESILMYCRDKNHLDKLFETYSPEYLKRYSLEDDESKYFWDTLKRKSGKQYYPVVCPDGSSLEFDENGNKISWLRSKARFESDLVKGDVKFEKGKNSWSVKFKQRLPKGKKPRSIFIDESLLDNVATTSDGSKELLDLFKVDIFENPKPVNLIKKLINFTVSENDIVLDYFSGSGTTAQAVMELNKDDAQRKFICVQIDELTDTKKTAYKAGYKTIFGITKARIEKSAAKVRKEHPDYKGDLGFKIFEIAPLFSGYNKNIEKLAGKQTKLFDGAALNGSQLEHLLTTWKVYDGIPLTTELKPVNLGKYTAYQHDKVLYLMDKGFSTDGITDFFKKLDSTEGEDKGFEVEKLVLFGYNFESKHLKEMQDAVNQYQNRKQKVVSVVVRH